VIEREAEIVLDAHEGEQARVLRDVADAAVDHAMRRNGADIGAIERDRAGARMEEAANCLHDGRLAGAVQSNQPGDHAGFRLQVHTAQNVNVSGIAGAHILHDEQRTHAAASPR
jgi:hypothetical protein